MSQNIYDTANLLERQLRESDAFQSLEKSMKAINASEESSQLFEEFKRLTMKIQEMQLTGAQPTEEELKEVSEVATRAQENDAIKSLVEAEQAVSVLMADLNRIITKPLEELYGNSNA